MKGLNDAASTLGGFPPSHRGPTYLPKMGLQQVGIATSWSVSGTGIYLVKHISGDQKKTQDGCGAAVGLLVGWEAQSLDVAMLR